jgi:hypothetical protein
MNDIDVAEFTEKPQEHGISAAVMGEARDCPVERAPEGTLVQRGQDFVDCVFRVTKLPIEVRACHKREA